MRCIVTIILLLIITIAHAQDSCVCEKTLMRVTYPKKAEQNKISGIVIVEWKVSIDGTWSNPIIAKSLGYGCDEEAMKAVRLMINANNLCRQKCKTNNEREGKLSQTFSFHYTDD